MLHASTHDHRLPSFPARLGQELFNLLPPWPLDGLAAEVSLQADSARPPESAAARTSRRWQGCRIPAKATNQAPSARQEDRHQQF
jgi:hypothetical protein